MSSDKSHKPQLPPTPDAGDTLLAQKQEQEVKPPSMFQVVMLNDDYTPMEFVVMVLQEFFSKDREQATQIMLKIHLEGRAVCGVYTKDLAATKVEMVLATARRSGHPLQCIMESV